VSEKKRIFISYSGDESKEIACAIKSMFEQFTFGIEDLCFVSDLDILSGSDWFRQIEDELATCKLGISIITRENMFMPWIYYEAGALVAKGVPVIPLIFGANANLLEKTPLAVKQAVKFSDPKRFCKMIRDIDKRLSLTTLNFDQLNALATIAHSDLRRRLKPTLDKIQNEIGFDVNYVYPSNVSTVVKKSMFISIPMASVGEKAYSEERTFLQELVEVLSELGYKTISPALEIESQKEFDGRAKATQDNFKNLKQVEYILAIYPRNVASSLLVEAGYGIALTKRVVIFHKGKLPFMLSEASGNISHVKTKPFSKYSEIIEHINKNGRALFENDLESDGES